MDDLVRFIPGGRRGACRRRPALPFPVGGAPWWASVVVCRGCCCGTRRKHPDVDHDRQLELFRVAAADAGSVLRVSGCRGICHLSNLVALRHAALRVEIGNVVTEAATAAVAAWIRDPSRVPHPRTGVVLLGAVVAVTRSVASPAESTGTGR